MTLAQPVTPFSPDDYLEWEQYNATRHEYYQGEVFAMAGASEAHVTIAGNIFAILRNHVRGGPCRAYIADMKLRAEGADAFFYPDVMVSCDPRDREHEYVKHHPVLVVEVLSPYTAAFDRGRKFAAYRGLESLREYMLVDSETASVEIFRRNETGHWVLYPHVAGEEAELASIGLRIPVAAVYEDVAFQAGRAQTGEKAEHIA